MTKILLGLIVALVLVGGGYWALTSNSSQVVAIAKGELPDVVANVQATSSSQAAIVTTNGSINSPQDKKYMRAVLHTNKGNITIEFFDADAPNTVANFTKLAGAGFYSGTKFHRVIKGFMIQGGDPLTKDDTQMSMWGTGGPGYKFADEIRANNHNVIGTISMANSGPNTNGSQFFINTANNNFLDGKHTTFGRVVIGMEVVSAIEATPTGANDRPVDPIIITSVTLE
jgi:cyclophilin family peptidyl-prolyl cis-trans isomerase